MVTRPRVPTRQLRSHPDLAQLKRQAKELHEQFTRGDGAASAEVHAHVHGARAESFALHDAQLVLARAYGFPSWPKLKAYVDGVTVHRFVQAAASGDLAAVRRMTAARPELVALDVSANDEHQALHHAVLGRQGDIVRFLMQHGADARKGVYPHRDATSPLTLAIERGYSDIETIIREEERRRPSAPAASDLPGIETLRTACGNDDEEAVIAALSEYPALMRASNHRGRTALHWAAGLLWEKVTRWLITRGADVNDHGTSDETPLDVIACERDMTTPDTATIASRIARSLRAAGAVQTARGAVSSGDGEWLRARHAEGALLNQPGLAGQAVAANRLDMLELLLSLGYDPDEAGPVGGLEETVTTWGHPLREATIRGSLPMVRSLLTHGANPNTNVYAASCALSEAHRRGHQEIIREIERHGGRLPALFLADLGRVDEVKRLLEEHPATLRAAGLLAWGPSPQPELLWAAIAKPSLEIVEMTLAATDWLRDDPGWFGILENGLYRVPASDRRHRLQAFGLVLDRANPNLTGAWNATLLHYIAANRGDLGTEDTLALATMLLDAGARLDIRDTMLKSTPLGWACRWGRSELVTLFLDRGADPIEPDAEGWARPQAWAKRGSHRAILAQLR